MGSRGTTPGLSPSWLAGWPWSCSCPSWDLYFLFKCYITASHSQLCPKYVLQKPLHQDLNTSDSSEGPQMSRKKTFASLNYQYEAWQRTPCPRSTSIQKPQDTGQAMCKIIV